MCCKSDGTTWPLTQAGPNEPNSLSRRSLTIEKKKKLVINRTLQLREIHLSHFASP